MVSRRVETTTLFFPELLKLWKKILEVIETIVSWTIWSKNCYGDVITCLLTLSSFPWHCQILSKLPKFLNFLVQNKFLIIIIKTKGHILVASVIKNVFIWLFLRNTRNKNRLSKKITISWNSFVSSFSSSCFLSFRHEIF